MKYSSTIRQSLRLPIGQSIVGHFLIIFAFSIKSIMFPAEPIVVMDSIRVDLVALPEKAKPKKKPIKKVRPRRPVKKFSKNMNARAQQRAMEALLADLSKKTKARKEPRLNKKLYKGNVLSPGSTIQGLAKIEYERYYAKIRQRIQRYLVLPRWLKDANLRVEVLIKLDDRGYVVSKKVATSSGNEIYDAQLLNAVKKSSPLPAPPARLSDILLHDGVTLGFPD